MSKWVPTAELLATLPCAWEELSEEERVFVEAMYAPGEVGGALVAAGRLLEDAVSAEEGLEGVTPSGPAPRRLRRP